MGVIAEIICKNCKQEIIEKHGGKEMVLVIQNSTCPICPISEAEAEILQEFEKCFPGHQSKDRFNDKSQEYSYIQGYNQAVSDILSNIKKLKGEKQ